MFERLKELICDMAKFLTRLGAGLILSALPISNKESHFVRYARRFGFRADHTKREPRAEIGGRGCIQGARPAIRAEIQLKTSFLPCSKAGFSYAALAQSARASGS